MIMRLLDAPRPAGALPRVGGDVKLSYSVVPARALVSALLLALLLLAAPIVTGELSAQDFQYDIFRPDGRAPAGVLAGHVLRKGQFEARLDLNTIDGEGLLAGDLPVSFEDALALFPEVFDMQSGCLTKSRYGPAVREFLNRHKLERELAIARLSK